LAILEGSVKEPDEVYDLMRKAVCSLRNAKKKHTACMTLAQVYGNSLQDCKEVCVAALIAAWTFADLPHRSLVNTAEKVYQMMKQGAAMDFIINGIARAESAVPTSI